MKQAIKAAWIHPMTPRTHSVTGPAWNKLAKVLSQQWKTKRSDTVRQKDAKRVDALSAVGYRQ